MLNTPVFRSVLLAAVLLATAGNAEAAVKLKELKTQWVTCGKAQVAAIFGKSLEVCVITDIGNGNDKTLEVKFCSGVMVGAGAKAAIGGASLDAGSMLCFTAVFNLTDHTPSPQEIMSDPELLKEIGRLIPGAIANLPVEQLNKMGVNPEDIKNITFGGPVKFVDKSGDADVRAAANGLQG